MEASPLTIFVGVIIPPIMGLLTRYIKDTDGRFWASTSICMILGVFINLIDMNFNYGGMLVKDIIYSMVASGLMVLGLSKITYEGFWNNKRLGEAIPNQIIEGKQSPMEAMHLKPEK